MVSNNYLATGTKAGTGGLDRMDRSQEAPNQKKRRGSSTWALPGLNDGRCKRLEPTVEKRIDTSVTSSVDSGPFFFNYRDPKGPIAEG